MRGESSNWLPTFIAVVVFSTWAISMVVGMLNKDYQPPVAIYPLLLAVAGGVWGFKLTRKENGNE